MMSPPDQPSPRAPAGARHFGPQSHWSSEILNGPGLGRTRDLKIPALSENLLRRSHARVLVLQVLFPLHSIPSLLRSLLRQNGRRKERQDSQGVLWCVSAALHAGALRMRVVHLSLIADLALSFSRLHDGWCVCGTCCTLSASWLRFLTVTCPVGRRQDLRCPHRAYQAPHPEPG